MNAELGAFVLETRGREVMTVVRELRRDGRVRSASPNYLVSHFRTPNDPLYPQQWHYQNISLPAGWDLTTGATDRVVAVVDSGLDPLHEDLAGKLVPGYDFVLNTTTMSDPDGHGTHVSGTVGAATHNAVGVAGVDWNTRLMPVRVLGAGGTMDDVYRGIVFAAGLCVSNSSGITVCPTQQGQVINLSLGMPNRTMPGGACHAMPDTILKDAVAWALANGSAVVAAAGNDNCPVVTVPAAYPGVIAVNRDLTPAYVKLLLASTATGLGSAGWDQIYGHGLVHAVRAVAAARDRLTARNSDFIVRIRSGATVIAEARADAGGSFLFENAPAGSYTIEGGTDVNRNGVLGEPGEFFGSATRVVAYTGDVTGITLSVTAR